MRYIIGAWLVAAICVGVCGTLPAANAADKEAKPKRVVQIYLADSREADGLIKTEVKHGDSSQTVYRHAEALFDETDLKSVELSKDLRGEPSISLKLTDEAGKRMRKVSAENIDKHLVFYADGKILSAPRIASIVGDQAEISGKFTEGELKPLVAAIEAAIKGGKK